MVARGTELLQAQEKLLECLSDVHPAIHSGCPGTHGTVLFPGLDGGGVGVVVAMPGTEEVTAARSSPPATCIPAMA